MLVWSALFDFMQRAALLQASRPVWRTRDPHQRHISRGRPGNAGHAARAKARRRANEIAKASRRANRRAA